jgi:hypothetical protein
MDGKGALPAPPQRRPCKPASAVAMLAVYMSVSMYPLVFSTCTSTERAAKKIRR